MGSGNRGQESESGQSHKGKTPIDIQEEKKRMKKVVGTNRSLLFIMLVLTLSIGLAACGGGGSSSISGGTGVATIQGSVPGTVFVAVNNETKLDMGRAAATGTPRMFS